LYFNHEENYNQAINDQRNKEDRGVNLADTIKLKDNDVRRRHMKLADDKGRAKTVSDFNPHI
jgi:hypothetical protein